MTDELKSKLSSNHNLIFILFPLLFGILPLAARWLPGGFLKISYGIIVALLFLIISVVVRKTSSINKYWELFFAFFIFAFIQVINNSVPQLIQHLLHETPVSGNPLASTISGSVIMQLAETLIAVIPVLILPILLGKKFDIVYAQKGKIGRWFIFSIIAFIIFYIITLRLTARHLFPIHGIMTFDRYLNLTPSLLLMVISNGFQEEFLFRGLFLRNYKSLFGFGIGNILQALIFTIAHIGVTYTPIGLVFLFAFVFPIGLISGYLMNKTDSVLSSSIFHAGADIPIYLAFLTFVS